MVNKIDIENYILFHNESTDKQVQTKLLEHTIFSVPLENESWNCKYHHLLILCDLKSEVEGKDLPFIYRQ